MRIWTDGGCIGNGSSEAVGAWAFVAENGVERYGRLERTTNNRAELQAIINAIAYAAEAGHNSVTIITDSQLCINCCIGRWKRKANRDMWDQYAHVTRGVMVSFKWVRGHSGDTNNERCDKLCALAMARDGWSGSSAASGLMDLESQALEHMRACAAGY